MGRYAIEAKLARVLVSKHDCSLDFQYEKRDELVIHCAFDDVLAAETAALAIVALDWWLIFVQYLRSSGVSHDRRVCLRCDVWPLKGPKLNRVRL